MSNVFSDPKELQKIQTVFDLMSQSGINERNNLIGFIEEAKSSGNLEPENYEQLMSSEYLGSDFQQVHDDAYNVQIKKMQQFLSELGMKLDEYLRVN